MLERRIARVLLMVLNPTLCLAGQLPSLSRVDVEGCGNPMVESQLWIGVPATVDSVAANGSIRVSVTETSKPVNVRVAGVAVSRVKGSRSEFLKTLRERLSGQAVKILLNPSDWVYKSRKPTDVTGSVTLADGTDVGLFMIERGIGQYQKPPAYKMSRYLECRYRVARPGRYRQTGEELSPAGQLLARPHGIRGARISFRHALGRTRAMLVSDVR